MKTALLPRLQGIGNVAGAALLLWLSAPLVSIDGRHPFDGRAARAALLAGIALAALLLWLALRFVRRRRNARLFAQLQSRAKAADAPAGTAALAQRFADAMKLLRGGVVVQGSARPHWWQRRRQVYQLPWYLFIGAPGAGKTTALLHSGLRFPLAERLGRAPVAGIGGTRQCDWWFTEQAVFIDTAGRYTTQDSQVDSDAREWGLFLRLLRRYRPVQPINGVIVTVSAPDLLQGGAELAHQAAAVDRRLQELRTQLGLSFPVYWLVTKVDLLAGFVEFFGDTDAVQREQPWGLTFALMPDSGYAPGPDGSPALPPDLNAQLAELPARIAALVPQRLQAEPLQQRRAAIYHFAAQVEALLPALDSFARRAFRACAQAPRQHVRGLHFSSGTQEGNPIDRVLGELSRNYGLELRNPPPVADAGRAYFLTGLLQRLVIAEAPLAGTSLQRRRRRRWLAGATGSGLTLLMLGACAAWLVSYRQNADYVDAVRARVEKVTQQVEPARGAAPPGRIDRLLPLYALLNQLAASGTIDPADPPWQLGFGLFQGPRLARSAEQTYRQVLDRSFAPLLAERLAQALRQETDPAARYEALRIGLMLTTPGRLQRGEVRRWAASAFAAGDAAAGQAPGAGEQQEWLRHLDALLERNAVLDLVRLDDTSVRAARAALAAVPLAQRVHERLLRRARERLGPDPTLAELTSPAAVLAFAPADAAAGPLALPVAYTQKAWQTVIEPALEPTIAELADEADWVLGDRSPALQRLAAERAAREPLARQVAQRHAEAASAQWERLLPALQPQVPDDAAALSRFAATLAAADSPLRQLLRRLATELGPVTAPAATSAPAAAANAATPPAEASPAGAAYDAALAARLGAVRSYAAGPGSAAIDRLLAPLAAALSDPANPRIAELGRELSAEAAAAPPALRGLWSGLADALGAQQRQQLERRLGGDLQALAQACRRLTAERFPFSAGAKRDMPQADFARVFGPQGLLDGFFRTHLAGRVDVQHRPWRWLDDGVPEQAQAALRAFEMAEDIRRLFFPGGSALPRLKLQVTPQAMDAELLQFSADVDGQLLRYENGPRRSKSVQWPGPAGSERVLLRILPAGPSGVGAEVHEGPWALLRVLLRNGALQRAGAGVATARLSVDGRALSVELRADAASPLLLGELGRFRCPEAW